MGFAVFQKAAWSRGMSAGVGRMVVGLWYSVAIVSQGPALKGNVVSPRAVESWSENVEIGMMAVVGKWYVMDVVQGAVMMREVVSVARLSALC